jgi:hypothetical protein
MRRGRAAALLVAAAAFWLYRATLLPGFDFGDTGSFQASAGFAAIRSRDAYPLYFALARLFLWLVPGDPARVLNLMSAAQAAVACGLLTLVAAELSGSLATGIASAVLFTASYTFWSQAIIAEVYALHLVFVSLTLLLLLRWQRQPTIGRLSAFFAVYALGFGNHLSMILLIPAYTIFLFAAAPRGWRSILAPRIVALAVLFACAGACQYLWNFADIWYGPQPPAGLGDALARFWFDVTKTDWRDTTVLNVPASMLRDRIRMYGFDLRQQFGPILPAFAAAGLAWLLVRDWRRGVLLGLLYGATALWGFSYNVGDTHVFYLPSHAYVALLVAAGIAALQAATGRRGVALAAACLVASYGGLRAYHDYPALDRSHDSRPTAIIAGLTSGLQDRRGLLLTDMHWQIENGRSYFAERLRPALEFARMPDVLLYAPVLIADNLALGREVAATSRARDELVAAYGPLVATGLDPRSASPGLRDLVTALPPGTRYALCVLKPTREFTLDSNAVAEALTILTRGLVRAMPAGQYAVVLGRTGEMPALLAASDDPFTRTVELSGVPTEVRMESWLAADTIRRMGFGHVVAARQHTLIVERGLSFAAFDDSGQPLRVAYDANIFEPQPRYLIKIARAIVAP